MLFKNIPNFLHHNLFLKTRPISRKKPACPILCVDAEVGKSVMFKHLFILFKNKSSLLSYEISEETRIWEMTLNFFKMRHKSPEIEIDDIK